MPRAVGIKPGPARPKPSMNCIAGTENLTGKAVTSQTLQEICQNAAYSACTERARDTTSRRPALTPALSTHWLGWAHPEINEPIRLLLFFQVGKLCGHHILYDPSKASRLEIGRLELNDELVCRTLRQAGVISIPCPDPFSLYATIPDDPAKGAC